MTKRILIAVAGLLVLIGLLGGIKVLQIRKMIAQGAQAKAPAQTVTTAVARGYDWDTILPAVGSLEAVQGILVTAELSGKVIQIAFEPGAEVESGDLLIRQDISSEQAQLKAAEATAELARLNFERSKKLLPDRVVSQSDYDNAVAQLRQANAQAETIRATIAKKTIRAPFAGRLGIRLVNLGQVINDGEPIVSLQSLDPIYVNFMLPQQQLAKISTGLTVRISSDAQPGRTVEGVITAINPEVDSRTRNVRVQATVSNPGERLRPGMFVNVAVVLPVAERVLAVPATAILYAPYSDSVFVVETRRGNGTSKPTLVARQQFVEVGEKRGDFIAVRAGLQAGDAVVSTGVFKLRNGQAVEVDNQLSPPFELDPKPAES